MLLLTQSLGVSDIPDLIVAALWGVAAVLAVMTCFISKNKRRSSDSRCWRSAAAMARRCRSLFKPTERKQAFGNNRNGAGRSHRRGCDCYAHL